MTDNHPPTKGGKTEAEYYRDCADSLAHRVTELEAENADLLEEKGASAYYQSLAADFSNQVQALQQEVTVQKLLIDERDQEITRLRLAVGKATEWLEQHAYDIYE